jgi:hypothetical protein
MMTYTELSNAVSVIIKSSSLLILYGLFYDRVSISDYMTPNDRLIGE